MKNISNILKAQKNIHKVILYGGTGQAKVVRPIVEHYGAKVVAVFDDTIGLKSPFKDTPLYTGFNKLVNWAKKTNPKKIGFVITIGNPNGDQRLKFHDKLVEIGFVPFNIIDPTSIIANDCEFEDGIQILAGTIIMPEVKIGKQCIVNTGAIIDHECVIKSGSEISPGATLCGKITVEKNCWIGAGATILPRLVLGENSIVGASAVVTKNVKKNFIVVGNPAKKIKKVKK